MLPEDSWIVYTLCVIKSWTSRTRFLIDFSCAVPIFFSERRRGVIDAFLLIIRRLIVLSPIIREWVALSPRVRLTLARWIILCITLLILRELRLNFWGYRLIILINFVLVIVAFCLEWWFDLNSLIFIKFLDLIRVDIFAGHRLRIHRITKLGNRWLRTVKVLRVTIHQTEQLAPGLLDLILKFLWCIDRSRQTLFRDRCLS